MRHNNYLLHHIEDKERLEDDKEKQTAADKQISTSTSAPQ